MCVGIPSYARNSYLAARSDNHHQTNGNAIGFLFSTTSARPQRHLALAYATPTVLVALADHFYDTVRSCSPTPRTLYLRKRRNLYTLRSGSDSERRTKVVHLLCFTVEYHNGDYRPYARMHTHTCRLRLSRPYPVRTWPGRLAGEAEINGEWLKS